MIRWQDIIEGERDLSKSFDHAVLDLNARQFVVLYEILQAYQASREADPRIMEVVNDFRFDFEKDANADD
jgi:hypothetical protein